MRRVYSRLKCYTKYTYVSATSGSRSVFYFSRYDFGLFGLYPIPATLDTANSDATITPIGFLLPSLSAQHQPHASAPPWTAYLPADEKTLTFLEGVDGTGPYFAKDKNHVYACCYIDGPNIVQGADPETFMLLGYSGYYEKDKHHVYQDGGRLSLADPTTFNVLPEDPHYGKDAHHVYVGGSVIPGADPSTFRFCDSYEVYSRDRKHVYWEGIEVVGADSQSFVSFPITSGLTLGGEYGKDSRNIYFKDHTVPGADLLSFMVLDLPTKTSDATDRNHRYLAGRIIY
jgi:hypothetical protein